MTNTMHRTIMKEHPCALFTGQREKGFLGSMRAYKRQDTEHQNEFLRSLYENATLTEESRIKVENMKADVLMVAPERDNEWPSPTAVRRMERKLSESGYSYRVSREFNVTNKTIINRLASLVKNGFVEPILVSERIRSYKLSDFSISHEKELIKEL